MPLKHTRAYLTAVLPNAPRTPLALVDVFDDEDGPLSSDRLPSASNEDRAQKIIDVLLNDAVGEDDKPEAMKEILAVYFATDPLAPDVDSVVLQVLHRYREDILPTGQTFSRPSTPTRPSVSRSPSFRRAFNANLSLSRRGQTPVSSASVDSRPHSPSPLGSRVLPIGMDDASISNAIRHLSVTASEFKPRPQAPASPQAIWGYNASPLGTPRLPVLPGQSPSSGSFFPTVETSPTAPKSAAIPRDPWSASASSSSGSVDEHFETFSPRNQHAEVPDLISGSASLSDNSDLSTDGDFDIWSRLDASDPALENPSAAQHVQQFAYSMTPLDLLCSVFADSSITPADLEDALSKNAWDVDRAIEYVISNPPAHIDNTPDNLSIRLTGLDMQQDPIIRHPVPRAPLPGAQFLSTRDAYPMRPGSGASSPRWGSRPVTPTGSPGPNGQVPYSTSAATNRVCRYYLQGNCLRSDCRYNHDISKAVCRFWLKGHCLKGPDRCDFMHMIPPHLAQDVALLRLKMASERRTPGRDGYDSDGSGNYHRDEEEDFPTLGSAARARQPDPSTTRWAAAVKSSKGTPVLPGAGTLYGRLPPSLSSRQAGRPSPRIVLRPPKLLPTISTGQHMSESYAAHRKTFLDLGAARARSLTKAADCWKRGDGAGAKEWSRMAQSQDQERLQAGRDAANQIVKERKKLLKAAVLAGGEGRDGRADPNADRAARGKEIGGNLGVCLGVADNDGPAASQEERMEVAMDLHGLHAEEATELVAQFLNSLDKENFHGLAFLVLGQEKHSVQHQVKTRLSDAAAEFLDQYKYPWRMFAGVIAVDPRQHV